MSPQRARLLVRSAKGAAPVAALGAAGNKFRAAPLFENSGGDTWRAAEAEGTATIGELWDAAYEAALKQPGTHVEPDAEQAWTAPITARHEAKLAGAPDPGRGQVNPFNSHPAGKHFGWHLDDEFTQLRSARNSITNPEPVRAAVFDVGYDPNHKTLPLHVRGDLERNYTGEGDPKSAVDPDREGLLEMPGHGTATLAILAGRQLSGLRSPTPSNGDFLGGAPLIEVVPIRIAKSVVLLRTSSFAEALNDVIAQGGDPTKAIDVISMSMGGVASAAWADAVNKAYEAGIILVTAAGNNFGRPKSTVFPARFSRVLSACGVMANFEPYVLGFGTMSGNYGPDSKMDTALAAFSPNIPWAEISFPDVVDWDGQGTSSATPQIASAACLYLQTHKSKMSGWAGWQKVEMVRHALFESASHKNNRKFFGKGVLKAMDALKIAPSAALQAQLGQQKSDSASFAFFQALRGSIFAAAGGEAAIEELYDLELTQLIHRDANVEAALEDPDADLSDKQALRKFAEAAIESRSISKSLRTALKLSMGTQATVSLNQPPSALGSKQEYQTGRPEERQLRVYAFDPAASRTTDTAEINQTMVSVPWEELEPGPAGEYLEVVDHDPASGCFYAPVNLDEPHLLASGGLAPAEGNPKFHQQMVYAVAMRTIKLFESALGRLALWSPLMEGKRETGFVQRLRIYPHALRQQNAYYNPLKRALLFGYFPARPVSKDVMNPGGMVFTCLSHDVVAHETSHALLDGMARGLVNPTNPDMLAFHEAFADIVALFQHFTLPKVLTHELARSQGNLHSDRILLGKLAQEFGQGSGMHGALRSYISKEADPNQYDTMFEPHARGALLVAAVFDAFLTIYERRIEDLRRIATGGTGVLSAGDLHPDLVSRFADEASRAANQVLKMCVRALDYCPPVDLTYGDYIRALITADCDLFPEDTYGNRTAMLEAFRRRGIYPRDVRTLSEDAIQWRAPRHDPGGLLRPSIAKLRRLSGELRRLVRLGQQNRGQIYELLRKTRAQMNVEWRELITGRPAEERFWYARELGLTFGADNADVSFEVHSLNFTDRDDPGSRTRRDVVVGLRQERTLMVAGKEMRCTGGATVIIDADSAQVRYVISKRIDSEPRQLAIRQFLESGGRSWTTYFDRTPLTGPGSRFAMIHGHEDNEEAYA